MTPFDQSDPLAGTYLQLGVLLVPPRAPGTAAGGLTLERERAALPYARQRLLRGVARATGRLDCLCLRVLRVVGNLQDM